MQSPTRTLPGLSTPLPEPGGEQRARKHGVSGSFLAEIRFFPVPARFQKQPRCCATRMGYFFPCFYELKCSSPQARVPGDPRAFIIHSDSLPAPAPRPVAARAANHPSPCQRRGGDFTAGGFHHGGFAGRARSPLSAVRWFRKQREDFLPSWKGLEADGHGGAEPRQAGGAGSASSVRGEAARLRATLAPRSHPGCAALPCSLNYEWSFWFF